jgi:transposase
VNRPKFKDFKKAYYDLEKYPTLKDLANKYGVSERSVLYWINYFEKEGNKLKKREKKKDAPQNSQTPLESIKLKGEIKYLQAEIKRLSKLALSSDKFVDLIHGSNKRFNKTPTWITAKKTKKELHGIPCLFLSDIHFDEYVDGSQINNVNEFSRTIAKERIKNTFETAINILNRFVAKPNYDGAVIALGGDLLSGNIHEELSETNDAPILSSLLELTQILIDGITTFADTFDRVFVPCVVGNHGRLHKKPRCKNRVFDNYEWLIYQLLSKHFKDDNRVTFLIPDGPDAVFKIYNKTFLLTHGDQFRGGSGISGIMTPLHLGLHKKQKKQSAIHQSFDVMMLGHFHQYIHTNSLVVNGSVKGYDEFANINNFNFEPPQQALWINHPQYGMVFRTPVLCDKSHLENDKNNLVEVFK